MGGEHDGDTGKRGEFAGAASERGTIDRARASDVAATLVRRVHVRKA